MDTGPLVAFLDRRDAHHDWALKTFDVMDPPLHTCEPVISEATFLLRTVEGGQDAVMGLVQGGLLSVSFALAPEALAVRKLMAKYASVPMSLADACLVRMCELEASPVIATLDGDFHIYRRNGRHTIPLITPR